MEMMILPMKAQTVELASLFAMVFIGIPVCILDIRSYHIPNGLTLGGWGTGLILLALYLPAQLEIYLSGSAMALAVFLPVFYLFPGKMGGGDVKLALLVGGLTGPFRWFFAHFTAVFFGILFFLVVHKTHFHKKSLPFGPFLCLGGVTALLPCWKELI